MLVSVDVLETKDIQKAGPQNWLSTDWGGPKKEIFYSSKHHPFVTKWMEFLNGNTTLVILFVNK